VERGGALEHWSTGGALGRCVGEVSVGGVPTLVSSPISLWVSSLVCSPVVDR
jgi:hypothetical protein